MYADALAEKLAEVFHKALLRQHRQEALFSPKTEGLETPLCNDVLLGAQWREEKSWRWKKLQHINILESASTCRLLKELALAKPCARNVLVMDSNVALSALVKGRSPSLGLRPSTRRAGAICVAGALDPA